MPKESWAGDQEQESYKAWLKSGGTRADCSHELVMAPSLLPQCLNPFSFVEWSNLYILSLPLSLDAFEVVKGEAAAVSALQ